MPKVRDAIRLIARDGWRLVRTRGSHRVFKYPDKKGQLLSQAIPASICPRERGTMS